MVQEPNCEDQRQCRGGEDGEKQDEEEEPVVASVRAGLLAFAKEEAVVATIGFPRYVEEVAYYGNRAYRFFQKNICKHANQGDEWGAAPPCGEYDEARGDAGESVTDAGDPADYGVEAETDLRAGDAPHVVEEGGEVVELFVGGETAGDGAVHRETIQGLRRG